MASFLSSTLGTLDSPIGIFLLGWLLVVGGLALQSVSWALVVGGLLLIGVVVVGVVTGGAKKA